VIEMTDESPNSDPAPKEQTVEPHNKKVQNTVPTLYPDIEFVNRTLP
jgi:hypothetical protein